ERLTMLKKDFLDFHIEELIETSSNTVVWMKTTDGAMQHLSTDPSFAQLCYNAGHSLYDNIPPSPSPASRSDLNTHFFESVISIHQSQSSASTSQRLRRTWVWTLDSRRRAHSEATSKSLLARYGFV